MPSSYGNCNVGAISPDAAWIIYDCSDGKWVIEWPGDAIFRLPYPFIGNVAWSPESQRLLICGVLESDTSWPPTYDKGKIWLYSLANDTAHSQLLVEGHFLYASKLYWAPDGQSALVTNLDNGIALSHLRLDGTLRTLVTEDEAGLLGKPFMDIEPAWAPDNRHIAYLVHPTFTPDPKLSQMENTQRDLRARQLWVLDLQTGQRELLCDPQGEICASAWSPHSGILEGELGPPAWSPDGRSIAVVKDERSIAVIDVQTRQVRIPATLAYGGYGRPVWSPDSRRLVVNKDAPYVLNLAEGTIQRLDVGARVRVAQWSSDGTQLVAVENNRKVILIPAPQ